MERKINVNKNLFEITEAYPEVISLLVNKGFSQLDDENKRKNFGKQVTLKQAAELKNLDLEKIIELMEVEIDKKTSQKNSGNKNGGLGNKRCF